MTAPSPFGALWRDLDEVDSTNEEAARWAREGAPHGAVVMAAAQTAGRGRRGRSWSSPSGRGLYISWIVRPDPAGPVAVAGLTMLAALAVARVVSELTGIEAHTKWPNDVLLHERKVAGILCEADFAAGRLDYVVVGVGVNVNARSDDLPERPLFPATSLWLETGDERPVRDVGRAVVAAFADLFAECEAGNWPELLREFEARCSSLGRQVEVRGDGETYRGVAESIAEDGVLVVRTVDGPRRVIAADVLY